MVVVMCVLISKLTMTVVSSLVFECLCVCAVVSVVVIVGVLGW